MSYLAELWKYRYLIKKIAITDLKIRYKHSILGFFWSILEPLLIFLVLYFVFTNLMKMPIEHYQLFLLLGILLWNFLARGTSASLGAIMGRADLVKKTYFPREILVISTCITALLMTFFELIVFAAFMLFFNVMPTTTVLIFPIILVGLFFIVLGISLAISAINVIYRDIQYIWAILLQAMFFLTPIIYSLSVFPESSANILKLSPMAVVIDGARNSLIYGIYPSLLSIVYIYISAIVLLAAGLIVFRHYEWRFSEEL